MKLVCALLLAGVCILPGIPTFAQPKVQLVPTFRLPDADGVAQLTPSSKETRVDVELNDMKPATLFGGDYATYVLWLIGPDGRAVNHGEFQLFGDESELHSKTSLRQFDLMVTAEPHYLVQKPSRFIVMQLGTKQVQEATRVGDDSYYYERDTLKDMPEATGEVRTGVHQAFAAVRLAQRAGAGQFAAKEMAAASTALDLTLTLAAQSARQGMGRHAIELQARETVRLAVAAQRKARDEEIAQTAGDNREAQPVRKGSITRN